MCKILRFYKCFYFNTIFFYNKPKREKKRRHKPCKPLSDAIYFKRRHKPCKPLSDDIYFKRRHKPCKPLSDAIYFKRRQTLQAVK